MTNIITIDSIRVPHTEEGAETTHIEYAVRYMKRVKSIYLIISHKKFDDVGYTYMPLDDCNFMIQIQNLGRKSQLKLYQALDNVIDNIDNIHALVLSDDRDTLSSFVKELAA